MKINSNDILIKDLVEAGYLKTPHIIEAFKKIDRADFVPENLRGEAYLDAPLPIGAGQTISQPLTVAFMLELLQPEPGDKVLDIGFGSGWTAALLAEIVSSFPVILSPSTSFRINSDKQSEESHQRLGDPSASPQDDKERKEGKVYAMERIPELCEFGKKNIAKYNFLEEGIVEAICADGTRGWPEAKVSFDKIIAGASGEELPGAWREQLRIGGRIVVPIKWSVWLFIKKSEKEFEEFEYPGFAFVPLISDTDIRIVPE